MADDLVKRLSHLDCCAVSDALDSLGIEGVAMGIFALTGQRRIVGRAVTIRLGPGDGRTVKRHLGTAAVEQAGPGSIIVIDHCGRTEVAGWGGILSLAAHLRGVAGVVIDGAVRDADEARELDFPIYARGAVARTARGRIIELDWNVAVTIAGIKVAPGDLVIADGSGVAVIPAARGEEVVAIAEKIVRKESLMAAAVRAGTPVSAVMSQDYETMLRKPER